MNASDDKKHPPNACIRHLSPDGVTVSAETLVTGSRLAISARTDADICLPDGPQAHISVDRSQPPRLRASEPLPVNGEPRRDTILNKADSIALTEQASLCYRGLDPQRGHLFELSDHSEATRQQIAAPKRRRALTTTVIALLLLAALTIPLWGPGESNSNPRWLASGPLHRTHQTVTDSCNDCHTEPFAPISNDKCFACHTMKRHLTREQTGNHPLCITCHREHNEPSTLINRDQRLCTQCHDHPEVVATVLAKGFSFKLERISDFATDHPDFSPVEAETGLSFSHQQHLNLDEEKIDHPLQCADCHQSDEFGEKMLPIAMAQHCGNCHSLEITANGLPLTLPHGDLNRLATTLQRTLQLNLAQSEQKISELFNGETCGNCHPAKERLASNANLKLKTAALHLDYRHWDNARFSHKRHEGELECRSCHQSAETSEQAGDSLLPTRKQCTDCHNSSGQPGTLNSSCADCHRFHTIDW